MKNLNKHFKWVESPEKPGIYINEEDSLEAFNHNLNNVENIKAKLVKTLGKSLSEEQVQLIEKL